MLILVETVCLECLFLVTSALKRDMWQNAMNSPYPCYMMTRIFAHM